MKIIFFLYLIVISFFAFYPNNVGVNIGGDKTNHIVTFIVFYILGYIVFKNYIQVFFYGITFGIYIELVQYFLPYRSCDFLDLLVDIVGLYFGFILVTLFIKTKPS